MLKPRNAFIPILLFLLCMGCYNRKFYYGDYTVGFTSVRPPLSANHQRALEIALAQFQQDGFDVSGCEIVFDEDSLPDRCSILFREDSLHYLFEFEPYSPMVIDSAGNMIFHPLESEAIIIEKSGFKIVQRILMKG